MLKKFIGNSTLYLLATVLNRGIAFLLVPVYTRYLLPSDYGVIAVCASIYSILPPLFTINLYASLGLLYYKLDKEEYRKLLSTVWLWCLLIPLVFVGIFEVFGSAVAGKFFPSIPWHPYLRLAVWIAYLSAAQQLPLTILQVEQKAVKYVVLTTLFFLISTGFLVYFIAVRQTGAEGSLQGQAIGLVVVSIISHAIIIRRLLPLRQITFSRTHLANAIRLCAPLIPYGFSFWALNLSDRWVLGYYVSTAEIGIYNLASNIGIIISVFGVGLSSAFAPLYYQQHKEPLFRERLPMLLSVYLSVMTLATLAISLLAPEILRIMASPMYYQAWHYVPVIAFAYWAYAGLYLLCLTVIQNAGQTKWVVVLSGLPALVNIILNCLLVPYYGIWAASLTTLLAFFMMAIGAYLVSRRIEKLPFSLTSLSSMITIAICSYMVGTFWFSFENIFLSLIAKSGLLILAAGLTAVGSGIDFRQIMMVYTKFSTEKTAV